LVALAGIGTIAAGVAKAYADCIQVSGHDGGTGASPVSSIRNAGLPWELGLAEAQQILVRNDLRGRVTLRVDGGMRTGRDVLIAALLGAEQFGFGTTALIASGCVMARRCHSNTCPVGIATQREELRAKFPGRPEHVVRFMLYVANQVRMLLASMGARTLDDVIGRADLLSQRRDARPDRAPDIDLSAILAGPARDDKRLRRRAIRRNDRPEPVEPLDERVFRDCRDAVENAAPFRAAYRIDNRQRSVGARLAGHIAHTHGDSQLPDGLLQLRFQGVSGQSFGAFCTRGMALHLAGEAQDYVGKSMDGGRIVIAPPRGRRRDGPRRDVVLGNTVLYGATGGALFAAGAAGERLAVRNSGALAVVEGCGDHACEYMTGGAIVILGSIGRNLGAGMSGGRAYVLDPPDYLTRHVNNDMVVIRRLSDPEEQDRLFDLITLHSALTRSLVAVDVLRNWAYSTRHFWLIAPRTEEAEQAQTPLPVVTVRSGAIAADRRRTREPNC
jgi:glutamate synthase domain-containing protein 3